MKTRNQIEEKYKWDLSVFDINEQNFVEKCDILRKKTQNIAKFGKITDEKVAFDALDALTCDEVFISNMAGYLSLKGCEDVTNSAVEEANNVFYKLYADYCRASHYILSDIRDLDDKILQKIAKNPSKKQYKRTIEDILRGKAHRLPQEVEKFFAGAEGLAEYANVYDKFVDGDMTFPKVADSKKHLHELSAASYGTLVRSNDVILRKNAFIKTHQTYAKYIDFFAANYIAHVKFEDFIARERKFFSTLESELFDEEVDAVVYDNLIKSVHEALPLLYDYFESKRKKLGLEKIYNYDTLADLGADEENFTFEEAIDLVKRATEPLGKDYCALIDRALDERWVDVFATQGKATGAFMSCNHYPHPFVLTNFEGKLDDVFTLAHELGHAMHSHYSAAAQPVTDEEYVIFVAEVASTTNEMLLLNYLMKNAKTERQKERLYDKLFESAKSTLFRQTMFAEFEQQVFEVNKTSGALSKDKLCKMYQDLNRLYFGPRVCLAEETQFEWARIPHFYNSFYVYKYATGFVCALNFATRFASGEQGLQQKYLQFLSAGSSKPPVEILADAGCDLRDINAFKKAFENLYLK